MRLLVLGGTRFLSRAVASMAIERGWDVTCACRGSSGPLPGGTTHLAWDRSTEAPTALVEGEWDAVVDVARLPSHVRRAVGALPDTHWVFVSTISVYADNSSPTMEPLLEPEWEDLDPASSPQAYGAMKVACEQLVADGVASSVVVRPGLIVGPGDPTGRFTYWPDRLTRGGEVLAPGSPDDVVQVIDVRDLAGWILDCCEARTTGVLDGVGEIRPIGELLGEIAAWAKTDSDLTWVDSGFLTERGVEPWAGPEAIPLWLPRPDYDGMMSHSPAPALAAGLRLRAVADTAGDTLHETPGSTTPGIGISPERERELLAAWRSR